MTQVNQAPPAPVPAAPAAPKPVDTPALLTRWNLIAVVTVVVFGLLSAFVQFLSWQADGRAADETDQLVRVQDIQSSLHRADALATNGYLSAGLESTSRQQEYDRVIADVLKSIADAAEAQPADREALAALNQSVDDYTTDVAVAAVYNRRGFPLGIAYQTSASSELKGAEAIVKELVDANGKRSEDAIGGQHPWLLLLVGLAALAVLFVVNRQMAQMFRRRFNSGLAIGAIIVVGVTVVAGLFAAIQAHGNKQTQDGAYRQAVDAANARSAADDAKAIESLRLINRGSGSTIEPSWEADRKAVEAAVPAGQRKSWDAYVKAHQQIVALDDSNAWKTAVIAATTNAPNGSTAALDTFDKAMNKLASESGAQASKELRGGRVLALLLSLISALLGLVAAVAVSRGIDQRRKEFL